MLGKTKKDLKELCMIQEHHTSTQHKLERYWCRNLCKGEISTLRIWAFLVMLTQMMKDSQLGKTIMLTYKMGKELGKLHKMKALWSKKQANAFWFQTCSIQKKLIWTKIQHSLLILKNRFLTFVQTWVKSIK